ncbi:unnamed protein product [Ambrosiozyma monospora]|uniref:Unnamed protein product n=1 Tax=Ambrosiozyma monospora TaxID=43982 RepID=A0ACB5SUV3_AMBMO|nr:unnamed protein product [Ambrosiozyma monospora]
MMKAMCFLDESNTKLLDIPRPKLLKATDAVGKVLRTTICGSDLHMIDGFLKESTKAAKSKPGRGFAMGQEGLEADGLQAEYCRILFADHSLYKCLKGVPLDTCVSFSDVLPTSYELGVRDQIEEGDSVAIVGMGPIGLGALLSLKTFNPSQIIAIDMNESRLKTAKSFGATTFINPQNESVKKVIDKLTQKEEVKPGVDLAIECVGLPETFEAFQDVVAPYGRIAVVGVHGVPASLKLDKLWLANINISTGLVSANSVTELMEK